MIQEIQLKYLSESDICTPEYISFLEAFHGKDSYTFWGTKMHWYFRGAGYRVLAAVLNGEYVGQTCAYKAFALADGEKVEMWWGVDNFVLEEFRGKGIGKMLQKQLHADLPNFSSVSYANLNGIIKRRCGAKEVLDVKFTYYPISCFISLLADLACKKLISRRLSLPLIRIPFLYASINSLFSQKKMKFEVEEIAKDNLPEVCSNFMEANLSETRFHVIRSVEYVRWKYIENPTICFKALSVSSKDQREGIIIISDVFDGRVVVTKAKIAKVLDCVIKKNSSLSYNQILKIAINYLRSQGYNNIDGVLAAKVVSYYPRLTYPSVTYMLSTMKNAKFSSGYVSYIDQDMERMS